MVKMFPAFVNWKLFMGLKYKFYQKKYQDI